MFIAGKEEFEYNLNALTKIEVTDSFMGQDENVRGCQPDPLYNCTTRQYLDALLDQCGCLPLSIRLSNKVFFDMYKLIACLIVCVKLFRMHACLITK